MQIEQAHKVTDIEILQKRLQAYQRAFNAVDDLMEYGEMSHTQFVRISEALCTDLVNASKKPAMT